MHSKYRKLSNIVSIKKMILSSTTIIVLYCIFLYIALLNIDANFYVPPTPMGAAAGGVMFAYALGFFGVNLASILFIHIALILKLNKSYK